MPIMKKAIIFILLLIVSAHAQEKGFLDIQKIYNESMLVTTGTYPDADDVLLDDAVVTTYQEDGKYVTVDDMALKVLTEQGKRSNRTIESEFNSAYSELEMPLLQIISKDGKTTNFDVSKLMTVTTDRSQMSSNIFDPNSKVMQVTLPVLEIGDIIRYVIVRRNNKPRVPNTFSDIQVFEYTSPIIHYTYTVNAPASLPLIRKELLAPVERTVDYSEKATEFGMEHRWEVRNVPQAFPEPKMPTLYTCVQRLLVSTIPEWEDVSKWYWSLCEPHLKTNEEIESKVHELIAGCEDDMTRIRSIFKFVSQEIRYMGETTETEAPGYEPHDVIATFTKRHGVCRDKAALLAAMLRSAGFQAYPVLIMAGPRKDPEVPQPYFNHAVTSVYKDGEYLLMDSTDESTAELFPAYLGDKSYLVARPEGEKLLISDVPNAEENKMQIKTICHIDEKGTLTGHSSLVFHGINDNAYRGFFATRIEKDNKQFLQKILSSIIPGADISHFEITPKNMLDTDTQLSLEIFYTIPMAVDGNSALAFMKCPYIGGRIGMVNLILGETSLDTRRFPFVCNYKCSSEEELYIDFDASLGALCELPSYTELSNDCIQWHRQAVQDGNQIAIKTRHAINTVQFSPEQYATLKKDMATIEIDNRKMPMLRKNIQASDSNDMPQYLILDSRNDYTISDTHNWKETVYKKIQILSYGAKKELSELELTYVPDMTALSIDFAKVYNGHNCTDFNAAETKYMDASWNAAAPRYPNGKTAIVNLPAVTIGSVIEYQYTKIHHNTFLPFNLTTIFRENAPITSMTVNVTFPKDFRLDKKVNQNSRFSNIDETNIIEETIENDNTVTCTWRAFNQPAMPNETSIPRLRYILPSITLTSHDCMKPYLAALWKQFNAMAIPNNAIKALAEEMSGMDKLRKVKAIRDYVKMHIITAGPNFNSIPFDYSMSPAGQTLNDGYGNSMDIAILAYTLLKEAGLNPELVLVNPLNESAECQKELYSVPTPELFILPLIRVKANGITCWLNESTQYAELGTCGRENAIALSDNGKQAPITVSENHKTRDISNIDIRLENDGSALVTVTKEYYGNDYNSANMMFSEQTPEERRRYHLQCLQEISRSAVANGELTIDFTAYPGRISYSANVPNLAVKQGELLYLTVDIPALMTINEKIRKLPYENKNFLLSATNISITVPEAFNTVSYMPQAETISLGNKSQYKLETAFKDGVIKIKSNIEMSPFITVPENISSLKEILRHISSAKFRTIILSHTAQEE